MRSPSVRTIRSISLRRPAALFAALVGAVAAVVPAVPAQAAESCSVSYRVTEVRPASDGQPARFSGQFTVTNTGTVTLDGMWWVPASWTAGTVVDQVWNAYYTPNSGYAFTPAPTIAVIGAGQSVTFGVVGRPASPASVRTATPVALACGLV